MDSAHPCSGDEDSGSDADHSPNTEELFAIMREVMETEETTDRSTSRRAARRLSSDPSRHECDGNCPFMVVNEDGTRVCSVLCICWAQTSHNDPVTAGIVTGLDEDGHRLRGVARPALRRRRGRNPIAASNDAMVVALSLEEDIDCEWEPPSPRPPVLRRRNASGEPPSSPPPKVARRELERTQLQALRLKAQETLDRLIAARRHERIGASASSDVPAAVPPSALEEELRLYIRRCQISGDPPSSGVFPVPFYNYTIHKYPPQTV